MSDSLSEIPIVIVIIGFVFWAILAANQPKVEQAKQAKQEAVCDHSDLVPASKVDSLAQAKLDSMYEYLSLKEVVTSPDSINGYKVVQSGKRLQIPFHINEKPEILVNGRRDYFLYAFSPTESVYYCYEIDEEIYNAYANSFLFKK